MKSLLPCLLSLPVFFLPVFAFDHSHATYDALLSDIVIPRGRQTSVDYGKLKSRPQRLLEYVRNIEQVTGGEFNQWQRDRQLAFLINAYNALTLKLILDNYPGINSIKDLGGLFTTPWEREWFTLFGETASLDYIEHELIRENYNEPRIHFAVNCASKGCPPLLPDAYTASDLDQQLEYATTLFLADPQRNRIDVDNNVLELSSIFKWYEEDFITAADSVQQFIAPYITRDESTRERLQRREFRIRYLDYDWSLNSHSPG